MKPAPRQGVAVKAKDDRILWLQYLGLLGEPMTYKAIAMEWGVSATTAKHHIACVARRAWVEYTQRLGIMKREIRRMTNPPPTTHPSPKALRIYDHACRLMRQGMDVEQAMVEAARKEVERIEWVVKP